MTGTQDNEYEKTAVATVTDNVTQAVPATEPTAISASVECPVCHTENPPSEIYCIDCGFLLSEKPAELETVPEQQSFGVLVTSDGAREFSLKLGENTVGRENVDILLTHNTVSRKHAKITVEEARVVVEDVGSTNGTWVDGVKIEPGRALELKDGAELVFGSAALIYRAAQLEHSQHVDEQEVAPSEPSAERGHTEQASAEMEAEPPQCTAASDIAPKLVARMVSKDGSLAFDLAEGDYKIGRRQGENDFVVPDPYTSGRHADLAVGESAIVITDVGSSNGTLINGVKIEPNVPCELHAGDEITIGQVVFVLEAT